MADFKLYYPKLSFYEGGYASAAYAKSINDSGGETYRGVARNYNKDWPGWVIIDAYKAAHGEPRYNTLIPDARLNNMTMEHSKKAYWDKLRLDEVKNQSLAELIGDFGFNSGLGTAAKKVQEILRITADGVLGPKTIEAINKANARDLFNKLKAERLELIASIDHLSDKVKEGLVTRTNRFFFQQ